MYMVGELLCQSNMTLEYRIHHVLASMLCLRERHAPPTLANEQIRHLFMDTEWSTIVLTALGVWRHNIVLRVLFFVSFVYFRILRIPYVYIHHVHDFDVWRDVPAWGLYLLNCYWFFKLNRKMGIRREWLDVGMWMGRYALSGHGFDSFIISYFCVRHFLLGIPSDIVSILFLVHRYWDTVVSYTPLFLLLVSDVLFRNIDVVLTLMDAMM